LRTKGKATCRNDNAHSVRLVDSLDRNVGHDTAKEFKDTA